MADPLAIDVFGWMEPVCVGVVGLWLALRFRRGRGAGLALARDYGLLAVASWAAEDSCIRLYGFYRYAPGWTLFLDQVPVMIAAIWPVVILSAREVGRALAGPSRQGRAVLAGAGIVLLDATFIECVATSTGLWSWTVPGPFGVPLMGIAGWACFALVALWMLDAVPAGVRPWIPLAAPAATHGLLLAAWWGAFRWFAGPVPEPAFAGAVATVCAVLAVGAARWTPRPRLGLDEMAARMVAAAVFFVLLAMYHRDDAPLLTLGAGFAPPWLVLMARSKGRSERAVEG